MCLLVFGSHHKDQHLELKVTEKVILGFALWPCGRKKSYRPSAQCSSCKFFTNSESRVDPLAEMLRIMGSCCDMIIVA